MGPKLLGGGASLLAAAFILGLPSIFEGEPADDVEPIRFGPPPLAKLAQAVRVTSPEPALPAAAFPSPAADPLVTSGGGGNGGGTESTGARDASAQGPRDGVHTSGDENESQGETGAGNGDDAEVDDGADLDDAGDDGEIDEDAGGTVGEDGDAREDGGADDGEEEEDD